MTLALTINLWLSIRIMWCSDLWNYSDLIVKLYSPYSCLRTSKSLTTTPAVIVWQTYTIRRCCVEESPHVIWYFLWYLTKNLERVRSNDSLMLDTLCTTVRVYCEHSIVNLFTKARDNCAYRKCVPWYAGRCCSSVVFAGLKQSLITLTDASLIADADCTINIAPAYIN